ncbi:NAD(P)H-dependent oxidoreductase subunit E [Desulfosarcina sp.]|uniref:NADH-quinone oxidoreductase subunit NuoE family protein n=1 Tax=Desulfosarcina sp. TaxID=2027861 RepID=UPI0029A88C5B|nr:NAD(P)H-dependent oxidoreductase subunit E [Desulfosarcina sp.]MDX2455250.1 NAD(P)H-dependent oxidoreductase subunit E [Desulfosarcina sp.]MDX2492785.1 NAD(P)H-dependent oxidoreductase subunit E [Desulfosarcina sp.]
MKKTDILEKYPPKMENVLLILHDLQNHNRTNYLSEKDLSLVAQHLNTTLGSIYGVASYYSMFSLTPRGKHIIRICRSPVCHCAGVNDVFDELTKLLKIDVGATTSDKLFTLETTECLGQCDLAPAMTVDEEVYGHLTAARIATIIAQYRRKRSHGRRRRG